MWNPFKKKKGETILPGESIEFDFMTVWKRDKREVSIMTEEGPIVLRDGDNGKLFINLSGKNVKPLKIEVVPDFNNKKLNFIEILDPSSENINSHKGEFSFIAGDEPHNDDYVSLDKYADTLDRNIENLDNLLEKTRKNKNLLTKILCVLVIINTYILVTYLNTMRYINLAAIIVCIYTCFYLHRSYKKMYVTYEKYKESRSRMFETIKEK